MFEDRCSTAWPAEEEVGLGITQDIVRMNNVDPNYIYRTSFVDEQKGNSLLMVWPPPPPGKVYRSQLLRTTYYILR